MKQVEGRTDREIVVIGLDGGSQPMLRYRDEMGLPDHDRSIVSREDREAYEARADRLREDAEGAEDDAQHLAAWRAGGALSTLNLRAAQHAAEREGATGDARRLAAEVDNREAVEGAS